MNNLKDELKKDNDYYSKMMKLAISLVLSITILSIGIVLNITILNIIGSILILIEVLFYFIIKEGD